MSSTHVPSADLFVVQALRGVSDVMTEQLASLGHVTEVPAEAGLWVVQIERETSDPQQGWARIRSRISQTPCREKVFAEPVLLDEAGGHHLPTGEVTVRFEQALSDGELRTFAEAHGLRIRGRTPYVPEQVAFLLEDPSSTYLPDLIGELRNARGVKSAWANTLSRYRKARS